MASSIKLCTTTLSLHNSSSYTKTKNIKTIKMPLPIRSSQMGFHHFGPLGGFRHMGMLKHHVLGRRNKSKGQRSVICASLFGVGAPEALVIGVVALLVFGPKGLAEVARNLGKTLRAFQPTIRELQEVSREFKSTLEREISLDDDDVSSMNNTYDANRANMASSQPVSSPVDTSVVPEVDPNGALPNYTYTNEEFLKIREEQFKASEAAQQDITSSTTQNQSETTGLLEEGASPNNAYTSEEYLKITEQQLQALAAVEQDVAASPSKSQTVEEPQPQAAEQETTNATFPGENPESKT